MFHDFAATRADCRLAKFWVALKLGKDGGLNLLRDNGGVVRVVASEDCRVSPVRSRRLELACFGVGWIDRAENERFVRFQAEVESKQTVPDRKIGYQDAEQLVVVTPDAGGDRDFNSIIFPRLERPGNVHVIGRYAVMDQRLKVITNIESFTNRGTSGHVVGQFNSVLVKDEHVDERISSRDVEPFVHIYRREKLLNRRFSTSEIRVALMIFKRGAELAFLRQFACEGSDHRQFAIQLTCQSGSFSAILELDLTERVGKRDPRQREHSGDRQQQGKRVATHPEAKLPKDRRLATGQGRFAFQPPA